MLGNEHLAQIRAAAAGTTLQYRLSGRPIQEDMLTLTAQLGTINKVLIVDVAGNTKQGYFLRIMIDPTPDQLEQRRLEQGGKSG